MIVIGWILVAISLGWILYKINVAYNSYGGTVMVAVYDAALFAPPIGAVGLYIVLPTFDIEWPIWAFIVLSIGVAIAVAILIRIAEQLGDREL